MIILTLISIFLCLIVAIPFIFVLKIRQRCLLKFINLHIISSVFLELYHKFGFIVFIMLAFVYDLLGSTKSINGYIPFLIKLGIYLLQNFVLDTCQFSFAFHVPAPFLCNRGIEASSCRPQLFN